MDILKCQGYLPAFWAINIRDRTLLCCLLHRPVVSLGIISCFMLRNCWSMRTSWKRELHHLRRNPTNFLMTRWFCLLLPLVPKTNIRIYASMSESKRAWSTLPVYLQCVWPWSLCSLEHTWGMHDMDHPFSTGRASSWNLVWILQWWSCLLPLWSWLYRWSQKLNRITPFTWKSFSN